MTNLTKDADKLLCQLYQWYLERIKDGTAKSRAKELGSSEKILAELKLPMSRADLDETLRELARAGYLHNRYFSGTIYDAVLQDNAVIYMQNRFKDGLLGVIKFLAPFVP